MEFAVAIGFYFICAIPIEVWAELTLEQQEFAVSHIVAQFQKYHGYGKGGILVTFTSDEVRIYFKPFEVKCGGGP